MEGNNLDFAALGTMHREEKILSSIDYTRGIGEYATAEDIASFMRGRKRARHIYSADLRQDGVVVQEKMSKYLAQKDHVNSGALKEALKSPLHLFYELDGGWRQKLEEFEARKSYFVLGEFIHQAILEPTRFDRVVVEPKVSLASKAGVVSLIEFWENLIKNACIEDGEDYEAKIEAAKLSIETQGFSLEKMDGLKAYYVTLKQGSGYDAVNEYDKEVIEIIRFNYFRYGGGLFPQLLKRSKREISMYYADPLTGIKLRIRPDAIQFAENIGCNAIISVKSTNAESIAHFAYQSAKLNYELTEGMYCDVASAVTGRDFNCVITIMVQNRPPYGVAALVWNGEDIEIGKYKFRQALQTVHDCRESRLYPGYDANSESGNMGLINMKQPTWNAKELYPVDVND